jgi:hypothetical protein
MSGCSSSNDGCAIIVIAYRDTAGADIWIHDTGAEIFLFSVTLTKLIGKKKEKKDNDS